MGDHTFSTSPSIMPASTHASSVQDTWMRLCAETLHPETCIRIDGESLEIAHLVSVAKYGVRAELDKKPQVVKRIEKSVEMLRRHLERGDLVYGVNTGYGGSADTRTNDFASLQLALVQHQHTGILTSNDTEVPFLGSRQGALHQIDDYGSLSMPTSWVKGLMLQRVNSIVRGHSAVSLHIVEAIMTLLQRDITPVIPLRGSISASGDLQPLSYVAGAIQGSPDIFVRVGQGRQNPRLVMPSSQALERAGIKPVVLGAKEGLGLLNGTAASVSVASLAINEANHLAILTQVLTGMAVEALCGTAESFSPFIAKVRPHRGQVEVAANIHGFLQGSRLSSGLDSGKDMHIAGLCQDRYPLRTSSQWIGPQLEDLLLATEQISIELNSTTDNPLTDVNADLIHHGGNFQATSITSAMEKTRTAIQMFGKLIFAQGSELLNSSLNKGLPPNLAADDPSLSFACKGIDINLAAYMSELAYLAHPVSNHVQSAELHNQAVNSLALVSARYTAQSIEILAQMCAAYLFALCQALDLRVLQARFLARAHECYTNIATIAFERCYNQHKDSSGRVHPIDKAAQAAVITEVWIALRDAWNSSTNMDLMPRAGKAARAAAVLFQYRTGSSYHTLSLEVDLRFMLYGEYANIRSDMFENHVNETPKYLGQGAKKMYHFVRWVLKVPFHRGLEDDPVFMMGGEEEGEREEEGEGEEEEEEEEEGEWEESGGQMEGEAVQFFRPKKPAAGDEEAVRRKRTIGSWISVIYEALRAGLLQGPVMQAVKDNEG